LYHNKQGIATNRRGSNGKNTSRPTGSRPTAGVCVWKRNFEVAFYQPRRGESR